MAEESLIGWHFLRADGCLYFPPHTKVEVGQTIRETRPLQPGKIGLHADDDLLQCAYLSHGPICCHVRLSGQIIQSGKLLCASERTVLAMGNVVDLLRSYIISVMNRYRVADQDRITQQLCGDDPMVGARWFCRQMVGSSYHALINEELEKLVFAYLYPNGY